MSWLSDLAGKAENLLNKIDQNAAVVLQETEKKIQLSFSSETTSKKIDGGNSQLSIPLASTVSKSDLNEEKKQVSLKGISLKRSNKKNNEAIDSPVLKNMSDLKVSSGLKQSRSEGNFVTVGNETPYLSPRRGSPVFLDLDNGTNDATCLSGSDINSNERTPDHTDRFANMENELLRNEISVVNNEVSLLIGKAKNAEKLADEKGKKLHQLEKEYALALKENEKLLGKILELENNGNDVSQDSCSQAALEETIQNLREDKQNLIEKMKDLERSEMSNVSSKIELESDLKEAELKCKCLEEKLDRTKSELSQIQCEWKNYKIRANSTLLMKEKIIEELGGSGHGVDNNEDHLVNTLNTQINQLKLERDEMASESSRYQNECEKLSKEMDHLESRTTSTERQLSALREAFRQEKAAKEIAEHTVNSLSKELKSVQHETAKQISSLRSKVRESQPRETDLLKDSLPLTSTMNVSESGEDRFRLLTQALVGKQAALESITSDRNALRLQLEKTENKYRSDLITMRNNHQRIIQVNDTDDAKARFPGMMQENPWDSNLSRGVKKAYSTLDSFSVRIILHFWVLIVLFTYTPEAHRNK